MSYGIPWIENQFPTCFLHLYSNIIINDLIHTTLMLMPLFCSPMLLLSKVLLLWTKNWVFSFQSPMFCTQKFDHRSWYCFKLSNLLDLTLVYEYPIIIRALQTDAIEIDTSIDEKLMTEGITRLMIYLCEMIDDLFVSSFILTILFHGM